MPGTEQTPYQPLGRRVLCRPIVTEDRYPGSLIYLVPGRVDLEIKQQAEVVAVGPGAWDEEAGCFVQPDDRLVPGAWILHGDFMRTYITDDLFFLNDTDIVAILEAP